MAHVRRLIIAALVAAAAWVPASTFHNHPDWTAANRGWARGPVWYIMTDSEYREYARLRSDENRRRFISEFWTRRDPLPDTPDNELENEFWQRVRIADGHFGQDVKPGWKTERGKVFIMLGPPENVEEDHILTDRWGASRWIYDLGAMPLQLRLVLQDCLRIPAGRRFADVRVREEPSGVRSLSGAVAAQASVLRPTDSLPLAETLVRRVPGPDALRNLGYVMRVPEVISRLESRVNVSTVFSLVPVQARIDFRPTLRDAKTTAVAVTLGVRRADLLSAGVTGFGSDGVILSGYLTPVDDETHPYPLTGAFEPDPDTRAGASPEGTFRYQAICQVPPGRYLLDVAYQETDERIMGSLRSVIEVPAFSSTGLAVSSLVLSSRIDPLNHSGPGGGGPVPFDLGGYRVIPRTTMTYAQPSRLMVFYEVYGAREGDDGRRHLDLSYQFYLQDDAAWVPIGSPLSVEDASEPGQSWGVPLNGLPTGRYRLEVTVTDRVAELTVVRGTVFEISSDAPPMSARSRPTAP